jgi:hypothetical protein
MEKPAQWALVGAAWFLALTVAAIGFVAWRHFDALSQAAGASAVAQSGSAGPLADGETALCPVTHEKVVVGPNTPRVVYLDHVYYFSSTLDAAGHDPKRRFLMDPESFVHPGAAPPLEAGSAAPEAVPAAAPAAVPTALPTAVPVPAPRPASSTAKP